MPALESITRFAMRYRLNRERRQLARLMEALGPELRKDIGWPAGKPALSSPDFVWRIRKTN